MVYVITIILGAAAGLLFRPKNLAGHIHGRLCGCDCGSLNLRAIRMSKLSERELSLVATEIEPHVHEELGPEGCLDAAKIARLARKYASHSISSERSCQIVDEYLTGERVLENDG